MSRAGGKWGAIPRDPHTLNSFWADASMRLIADRVLSITTQWVESRHLAKVRKRAAILNQRDHLSGISRTGTAGLPRQFGARKGRPMRCRLVVFAVFLPLAGCGFSIPIGGRPTGAEIVERNADARRVLFTLRKRAPLVIAQDVSRVEALQDAPGTAYRVGREWLYLHAYPSMDAAAAARARAVQDPRNAVVQWLGRTHAFHCRTVVALYLGADPGSIAALTRLCGAPVRL